MTIQGQSMLFQVRGRLWPIHVQLDAFDTEHLETCLSATCHARRRPGGCKVLSSVARVQPAACKCKGMGTLTETREFVRTAAAAVRVLPQAHAPTSAQCYICP